jgi:hypothetical protein
MRSMLENLLQSLPPHRHAELHGQLDLLDRTIETHFRLAEDRALARIADSQGLGGAPRPGAVGPALNLRSAGASLIFVAVAVAAIRVIRDARGSRRTRSA